MPMMPRSSFNSENGLSQAFGRNTSNNLASRDAFRQAFGVSAGNPNQLSLPQSDGSGGNDSMQNQGMPNFLQGRTNLPLSSFNQTPSMSQMNSLMYQQLMNQGSNSSGMDLELAESNQARAQAAERAQAEREEELLLNLLISRRQRQMRSEAQNQNNDAVGRHSFAEDLLRMRREANNSSSLLGQHDMGNSLHNSILGQQDVGNSLNLDNLAGNHGQDGSQRSLMGSNLPNMNINNLTANSLAARGRSLAGNSTMMQSQRHDAYMQKPELMNSPLGLDVLERIDTSKYPQGGHDARLPDMQGGGAHMQNDGSKRSFDEMKLDPNMRGFNNQMMNGDNAAFNKDVKAQPAGGEEPPPKRKRPHKKKPADMPRRPLSAYNLFFSEERERILEEIEDKEKGDSGAGSGTEAAAATDSTETKSTEKANVKTKEKNEEKGEGSKDGGDKAAKDSNNDTTQERSKPKALLRPLVASDKKRRKHRKTHGKISFQLLAQKVGQRWKALSPDRRKYYQDLAQEDMKRQKKAMEQYYQKQTGSILM